MRRIVTAALTLEPLLATHAEAMFVVLCDPAIYEFENAPPRSREWLRERYVKLESRRSPDGRERWLNRVVRLPTHDSSVLIGYVQATVREDGSALIAYEFESAHWGRGLASMDVVAMIDELAAEYQTQQLRAVWKRANHRSMHLLERLDFALASSGERVTHGADADESLMYRCVSSEPAQKR
jgi:[ribosomal protein S5]-alanine N-acetyltransferase